MNTTAQLPSQAGTTLITWVATLSIVWVLASAFALVTGHVTMVVVLGLVVGLPAAIRATRSSNRRKAILRHAAARTAPVRYQAPAAR
jgi:hypothetical protein|nr:MAG TPA: hypothetical protein [Caudoviricetes sp.]